MLESAGSALWRDVNGDLIGYFATFLALTKARRATNLGGALFLRADWSYLGCHCIMIFSGRSWEGKAVVLYEVWTVLVLQEKEETGFSN